MYDYDVVFIGSGHACWHAALMLAKAQKKVAFVEEDTVAGTCTNWGCNAKILLDSPFELVDGLSRYRGIGVDEAPAVDWSALMAYKKQVISPVHTVLEGMFAQMGMPVFRGHGTLVDAHTVEAGGKRITADYIVLGTGERPRRLGIPGDKLIHDSRDFLDVDVFPKRIAFVGAGIISMEFASIAALMGSEVTVIHHSERILSMYPARYVSRVVDKLKAQGVTFLLNHELSSVAKDGGDTVVTFTDGSTLACDYVLGATGRVPNVENLGLEALGIAASSRGIEVDDHMRTAVPNVFASGDCVAKRIPKLTPTATFESNYIAQQILGLSSEPISYPAIPNLVFTLPRIAQVGVTLAEAEADPDRWRIETVDFGKRLLFEAKNESDAEFAFVFSQETGLLEGAAFYGQDAGVWADLAVIVINQKLTGRDLSQMIFTFPTASQAMLNLLTPLLPL
ncbi:MAG: NAD(P)/FAD-dependent oxidoreductase [Denitrobacterium sp.]|nr:NAD(P)/FAD-dependent oxidoreductase [Denitrobacterium sp.]